MGLARTVTEFLGPIGGAASIYTVASLFLVMVMGLPRIRSYSLTYVMLGGGLFVAYEICLALALAMANSRQQAVEMLVINYLWPALTVLLAVTFSPKKTNILVYPAIALAFLVWLGVSLESRGCLSTKLPLMWRPTRSLTRWHLSARFCGRSTAISLSEFLKGKIRSPCSL